MVIERAGQLLPKLLDFGIAKGRRAALVDARRRRRRRAHRPRRRRSARRTTCRPSSGSDRPTSTRAPTSMRSACSRIAASSGTCRFTTTSRARARGRAHASAACRRCPTSCRRALADVDHARAREAARRSAGRPRSRSAKRCSARSARGAPRRCRCSIRRRAMRGCARGPQPIADAIAHADVARRRPSRSTPRCASSSRSRVGGSRCSRSSGLPRDERSRRSATVREHARAVVGRDDGAPWLRLARAAVAASPTPLLALVAALAGSRAAREARRSSRRSRSHAHRRGARRRCRGGRRGARARSSRCSRISSCSAAPAPSPRAGRVRAAAIASRCSCGASRSPTARSRCSMRRQGRRATVAVRAGDRAAAVGGARAVPAVAQRARRGAAGRGTVGLRARRRSAPASCSRRCRPRTPTPRTDAADDRSPYPGLAAYGIDDADHFVGREREVETLANRLVRAPLIAVLGPSGVGKSSFIHAGLVPRLGEQHRVLTMRPGRHPMHALAALPPVSGDSQDESGARRAPARARRERAARARARDRSARGARHAVRRSRGAPRGSPRRSPPPPMARVRRCASSRRCAMTSRR